MVSIVIGFIPITILIIRNTIAQSEKNFKDYKVVTPTLIGIFILIIFSNFLIIKLLEINNVYTNIRSYEKLLWLNNYSNNIYINHFPKEIPLDAKYAKVEEQNGVLDKFYLSYNYNDNKELTVIDENTLGGEYKKVINNYDQLMSTKEEVQIPEEVIRVLGLKKDEKMTSNFKIILIDSTSVDVITHGYSYGIGINYDDKEVVYFSEKW